VIHERKLNKNLHISGPLTTCVASVTATLHEIEASIVRLCLCFRSVDGPVARRSSTASRSRRQD
jgi:hypothetical protein